MEMVTDTEFQAWFHATFAPVATDVTSMVPVLYAWMATVDVDGSMPAMGRATPPSLRALLLKADIIEVDDAPARLWLSPKGELLHDYLRGRTLEEIVGIVADDAGPSPLCTPMVCYCPGADEGQGCHNNPLFDQVITRPGGPGWVRR